MRIRELLVVGSEAEPSRRTSWIRERAHSLRVHLRKAKRRARASIELARESNWEAEKGQLIASRAGHLVSLDLWHQHHKTGQQAQPVIRTEHRASTDKTAQVL